MKIILLFAKYYWPDHMEDDINLAYSTRYSDENWKVLVANSEEEKPLGRAMRKREGSKGKVQKRDIATA
jgi:hypothetical protein